MKFAMHSFSKRKPAVECAVFVIHEAPQTAYRATGAAIIMPSGMVYVGVCACSPSDAFVRKVGRAKAIGRAYQNLLASSGYCFVGVLTAGHPDFALLDSSGVASLMAAAKVAVEENIAAKKAAMGVTINA